jgi:hypothetical protein
MLAFTRHPYLQLSASTLPFWVDILREAGILPGGLTRQAASGISLPAAAAANGGGGGGAGSPQAPETLLPAECCQVGGRRRSGDAGSVAFAFENLKSPLTWPHGFFQKHDLIVCPTD